MLDSTFCNFSKFVYQKKVKFACVSFDLGVFLSKTWKLCIVFILDINFGIDYKNSIIVIFEGVRIHFLHFFMSFEKKNYLHVLVLNFGVFFLENNKIKYFVHFGHQLWHLLEKYYNLFFEGVRLHFLHFCNVFEKKEKFACVGLPFWNFFEENMNIKYFVRFRHKF